MSFFSPEIAEQWRPGDTDWVVVAYRDNTGKEPQNFPEDSEAFKQFMFTGRKKQDKELLKSAIRER